MHLRQCLACRAAVRGLRDAARPLTVVFPASALAGGGVAVEGVLTATPPATPQGTSRVPFESRNRLVGHWATPRRPCRGLRFSLIRAPLVPPRLTGQSTID
jgi:hypothetical protein